MLKIISICPQREEKPKGVYNEEECREEVIFADVYAADVVGCVEELEESAEYVLADGVHVVGEKAGV